MKLTLHKDLLFLVASFLFLGHYLLIWNDIYIPFADNWMDDILCMPIILTGALWTLQRNPNWATYKFDWRHIVVAVVMFSITFEVLLPGTSPLHTADILDVFAYTGGAILWWAYYRYRINRTEHSIMPNCS